MQENQKTQIEGQFVVFTLGNEKYGMKISHVKEIVRWSRTTELPQTPDEVLGVIKLRNQVIPVISLRKQFGLPYVENLADTKIIILETGNVLVGINVDDVDEVVHIPRSSVDFPNGLKDKTALMSGIAKLEDYLLILIDLRALFTADILEQIEQNTDQIGSI